MTVSRLFKVLFSRLMSEQRSLIAAVTASACVVQVAFSMMSWETGREVSSICARVWYIVATVEREGGSAVNRCLALPCAIVVRDGS